MNVHKILEMVAKEAGRTIEHPQDTGNGSEGSWREGPSTEKGTCRVSVDKMA